MDSFLDHPLSACQEKCPLCEANAFLVAKLDPTDFRVVRFLVSTATAQEINTTEDADQALLSTSISDLRLGVRACNALANSGLLTVGQVKEAMEKPRYIRRLGKDAWMSIGEIFTKMGVWSEAPRFRGP